MLGAAEQGNEKVAMQAELFAAVFKSDRGAINFAGFRIEDLTAGPFAPVLVAAVGHKIPEYPQAHERTVFQIAGAKVASGMRNRRVEQLLNGSVEFSIIFADLNDGLELT